MVEPTKRLKSIIGHLLKKTLKIDLFSKDTQKGTCDNATKQNSEMFNEIPAVKHRQAYISHSYADRQYAYALCKELQSRFLLNCMLSAGSNYERMYRMGKVDHVLLLLSPDYLRCEWCCLDVKFAVTMFYDPNFNLKIIPVILRDIDWDCDLPRLLNHFVCIDAQKENDCCAKINDAMFNELPNGKNYHLYISYCDADRRHAYAICSELESRFLLNCMLFNRDFSPGVDIGSEIENKMARSANVLLLLSPDFLRNKWCDVEINVAVQMSYDPNFNLKIIPVILRDIDAGCDLPPLLQHYVCIDVQKENDCCAKINEAIYHTDRSGLLLSGISYRNGLPKSAFRYENGRNCVSFGTGIKEDTCTVEIDNQIFYELPPGKKYHLFIAHSSVDHQLAVDLCKELERRFLLKCMLFVRDFIPAKPIDVNAQHELERSVKVLLLLSPDFLNSQWCDMEARLAAQMSYDPNFNLKIIPVLVRGLNVDSDLPPFLKPFRYIDAQKEFDCPAKINEVFYQISNAANLIDISNFFQTV